VIRCVLLYESKEQPGTIRSLAFNRPILVARAFVHELSVSGVVTGNNNNCVELKG
jgi:hypothetical protein